MSAPSAARPPESVQRVKTLSYVVAAIGALSLILGIAVSQSLSPSFFGGLIGIAAYLYLATQVVAAKDWARIVIGVLAILGIIANVVAAFSSFGLIALVSALGEGGLVAMLVVAALVALVDAVVLVLLVVNAFNKDTAAWCRPGVPPVG